MTWRRADEGDVPEIGQEISLCVFHLSNTTVQKWRRMRVDVLLGDPPRIYGPGLPCDTLETDWPTRPDVINGRAIFWKEFVE